MNEGDNKCEVDVLGGVVSCLVWRFCGYQKCNSAVDNNEMKWRERERHTQRERERDRC